MRTNLAVLILVAALGANGSPSAPDPFSIHIKVLTTVVKSGEPIYLQIRMTNTSDHDLDCTSAPRDGLDMNYAYEVRDSSGKILPESHRNVPEESNGGNGRPRLLKPGATAEAIGGFISNHYDMSGPGQYTIQVSRRVSANPKDGVVKSNKITITVLPADGPPPTPK
jgi:hypothetical protein